jgi:serine protease
MPQVKRNLRRTQSMLAVVIMLLTLQSRVTGQINTTTGVWKGRDVTYVKGELLLKSRKQVDISDVYSIRGCPKPIGLSRSLNPHWSRIRFSNEVDVLDAAIVIEKSGLFDIVVPNRAGTICETAPNDSAFAPTQWALKNTGQASNSIVGADIQAARAWDISTGSSSIIVAVLDTGIPMVDGELSHPDLDDPQKFIIGEDFTAEEDAVPQDMNGHGTHVTGIVAVESDNSIGIAGVAWGCKILTVQVAEADGDWSDYSMSQGIWYAVDQGAQIINISAETSDSLSMVTEAVNDANGANVLIVAAVGNIGTGGGTAVKFPARLSAVCSNVVAVSATDHRDEFASIYSRYGPGVDVAAPGGHGGTWDADDIYSTFPNYYVGGSRPLDYGFDFGTSMAAPHVSGVAALILSVQPSLAPSVVRSVLRTTADDLGSPGKDNYYGYGRINAYKALKFVIENYGGPIRTTLVIPGGETWNIASGTTLTFSSNCKLRVEGVLQANNSTLTGSGGQWYGIEFYNGASNSTLYGCTIQNALYGVFVYNTAPSISHCTFRNNSTGIYAGDCWNGMSWNLIESNWPYGVYCANYGDANLTSNNIIRYNGWGVRGDATSQPYLGGYIGYNSLYWNDYYDVYSDYGGTIWALGNWWGDYPAYPPVSWNVDYSGAFYYDPNSWAKIAAKPVLPARKASSSEPMAKQNIAGIGELDSAYALLLKGQEQEAQAVFQSLRARYPDSFVGSKALMFLFRLQAKRGGESKSTLLAAISQHPNTRSAWTAQHLLVGLALKDGDPKRGLEIAEQLISVDDSTTAKLALYDAGNISWYQLDDKSKAVEHFEALKRRFPDDPLTISALVTMGEDVGHLKKKSIQSFPAQAYEFALYENYPNPFNPVTTIEYHLPAEGQVTLAIFDILGRQVAELAAGIHPAGAYSARWNASSNASGIYYARLIVTDEVGNVRYSKVNRLLLMK